MSERKDRKRNLRERQLRRILGRLLAAVDRSIAASNEAKRARDELIRVAQEDKRED
jgi:hypothetical protein